MTFAGILNQHIVIIENSRIVLRNIDNEFVQLIITSPPYYDLKDYDTEDQIGFNQSYGEYLQELHFVWSECFRILQSGCKLCINIGDLFLKTTKKSNYKIIPSYKANC